MRKVAIAYSSKDEVDASRQTVPHLLQPTKFDLWWIDGSRTDEGRKLPTHYYCRPYYCFGGPDAAIAFKLSALLASEENYTHIGLAENDVLLQDGWFEETMELFDRGAAEGLCVGAVSPRSYVDRVLIQRDGWAIMLNIGAGFIIFKREAAEIVLRSFRTAWWPDVVRLFAQVSGIDVRTYACFRGNEQNVTTDWQFEAQLAAHGLASLALTPARCEMIHQKIPLEQQGLHLVKIPLDVINETNRDFARYRDNLAAIRAGTFKPPWSGIIRSNRVGQIFYPHQLGYLAGGPTWSGTLELVWTQGHGPFSYRAGPGGASLSVRLSGICSFLVSGGDVGARVTISDTRSGFKASPMLVHEPVEVSVPGGPIPREVILELADGAMFYGLSTVDNQMLDDTFSFDWSQLPEAK